jgi:hypothetical protein
VTLKLALLEQAAVLYVAMLQAANGDGVDMVIREESLFTVGEGDIAALSS